MDAARGPNPWHRRRHRDHRSGGRLTAQTLLPRQRLAIIQPLEWLENLFVNFPRFSLRMMIRLEEFGDAGKAEAFGETLLVALTGGNFGNADVLDAAQDGFDAA